MRVSPGATAPFIAFLRKMKFYGQKNLQFPKSCSIQNIAPSSRRSPRNPLLFQGVRLASTPFSSRYFRVEGEKMPSRSTSRERPSLSP